MAENSGSGLVDMDFPAFLRRMEGDGEVAVLGNLEGFTDLGVPLIGPA